MKKSLIALSVLAATSAFAGGGTGTLNNVAVSENGMGDLLIAPVFFANGGWSSELKLVNNSTIYSTAVKVVFHRRSDSAEVLDFFVYLSPGDAWNGVVTQLASGALQVNAFSDDSTPQIPNGIVTANAGTDIGYIVVHENAAWDLGPAPVPKTNIIARLNADTAARVVYVESANRAAGQISTENIVTGTLRMVNSINNAAASLPLVAVANYNNRLPLTLTALTLIGNDQVGNQSSSYTTLAAFEAAIWGNNWSYTYDHSQASTLGSITFPTRHTFDNTAASHGVTFGTYPFRNNPAVPVQANVTIRDMSENTIAGAQPIISPIPGTARPAFAELGFFAIAPGGTTVDPSGNFNTIGTSSFGRGWVNVNMDGVVGTYNQAVVGAPVIATQFNTSYVGSVLRLEWFYPQFKVTSGARGND